MLDELMTLPFPLEHAEVQTNGLWLHVVQAGPKDGPLAILLHGFPECWFGWRKQIAPLVEAGYRVWIPDQRGYHRSDKPTETSAYHIDQLTLDIVGLLDTSGRRTCVLIGHDWGGVVAWSVANDYPERIERLVVMNVPHIALMQRHLTHDLRQFRKSWYILAFQFPGLSERLFSAGDFYLLRLSLSENGACSPEELQRYVEIWSAPGACTAMFNWYRACLPLLFSPPALPQIEMPTLILWGEEDRYLKPDMGQDMLQYCSQGEFFNIPYAGHFIPLEAATTVNRELLAFLARQ